MAQCVHCGSINYIKNGRKSDVQQYRCRDCTRSFSDKPRKFTYADKEKFLDFYLNNTGIRRAAHFMKCSPSMPVRWVRELAENLRNQLEKARHELDKNKPQKVPDIIELDEIYTRIKKGEIASQFGLLIVDGKVKLLRISSGKPGNARGLSI